MPEVQWVCPSCREKNPPFTEVCRNCLVPAPIQATSETTNKEADLPAPMFDTSAFKSFRYHSLSEVSQEKFGIEPEIRPLAWLLIPVFFILAFFMVNGALETFETGRTGIKGGGVITGQAAYLTAIFEALGSAVAASLPFRGPKWFSVLKRILLAAMGALALWSSVSAIHQLSH